MRTTVTDPVQTTIAAFSLLVMVLGLVIKYRLEIRQWIVGCFSNPQNSELPHLEAVSVDPVELFELQSGEHSSLLEHECQHSPLLEYEGEREVERSSLLQSNGENTTDVSGPEAAGGVN
ncbi:hypothetical protein K440DRAFT_642528 [Wilcoxina mikolae CBS 423.85]|nr:hypothetical protein K440DRAFT_642528 [Wilcoxina mikolae CBS 423.85]